MQEAAVARSRTVRLARSLALLGHGKMLGDWGMWEEETGRGYRGGIGRGERRQYTLSWSWYGQSRYAPSDIVDAGWCVFSFARADMSEAMVVGSLVSLLHASTDVPSQFSSQRRQALEKFSLRPGFTPRQPSRGDRPRLVSLDQVGTITKK